MKNISIPHPCSENWNEMTPTQKGAFCQKCALDVYDFTNKSGDEIRDILTLNLGSRVCGKIEPQQLEALNTDFTTWQYSNRQSFNRAWIFSLIVVFVLTLFSCEEDEEPVVKEIQKTAQSFVNTLEDLDNEQLEQADIQKTEKVESLAPQEIGAIITPPDTLELTIDLDEVAVISKMQRDREEIVGIFVELPLESCGLRGDIAMTPAYVEYLNDTPDVAESSKLSGITYPNPASHQTTLKVTMPQKGKVEIQLFALNGQYIRTIHAGRISKGESEYSVDLTDLETGSYFFIISTGNEKETVQFVKI